MRNISTVMAFRSVHPTNPRRSMRHTAHILPTALRPTRERKHTLRRPRMLEILPGAHEAPVAPATSVTASVSDEPPPSHAAALYPARERAAGGPQDLALYGCACGFAFNAAVEAGVHCPHCDSEQSW